MHTLVQVAAYGLYFVSFFLSLMYVFFSAADIFLWRNKKISAGVLGGATAMWVLFELVEYHLITLVCHISILSLAVLFLWSNASTFINKYGVGYSFYKLIPNANSL